MKVYRMAEREHRHRWRRGWLTVLRSGLILVALLLLNSFLVKSMFDSPGNLSDDFRVTQTLQFALPILMIFLEYWLYDFVIRFSRSEKDA